MTKEIYERGIEIISDGDASDGIVFVINGKIDIEA